MVDLHFRGLLICPQIWRRWLPVEKGESDLNRKTRATHPGRPFGNSVMQDAVLQCSVMAAPIPLPLPHRPTTHHPRNPFGIPSETSGGECQKPPLPRSERSQSQAQLQNQGKVTPPKSMPACGHSLMVDHGGREVGARKDADGRFATVTGGAGDVRPQLATCSANRCQVKQAGENWHHSQMVYAGSFWISP